MNNVMRVVVAALSALALASGAAEAADLGSRDQKRTSVSKRSVKRPTEATSLALSPKVFSVALYEDALVNALENTTGYGGDWGGYAYAIYQNGKLLRSGAAGVARYSPHVAWTPDTPFSMMSTGKTITAAAYVQLIAEREDISLGSPITPFLPDGWNPDPHLAPVTFRHLLSHTSGLTTGTDPWSGVKIQVETNVRPAGSTALDGNGNVVPAGVGSFFYSNTNFTLGRVMMAYMLDLPQAQMMEGLGAGDLYSASVYRSRVLSSIFAPIGLDSSKVDVQPIGQNPAGFYGLVPLEDSGWSLLAWYFEPTDGSTIRNSGAGFWNLSVKSYGKFIDALSHGQYTVVTNGATIDPWEHMTRMVDATNSTMVGLGLFRVTGAYGDYYTHNGGWSNGSAGACSRWMTYPNGVSAVWVANAVVRDANGNTQCRVANEGQMMIDAYDNAWTTIVRPIKP